MYADPAPPTSLQPQTPHDLETIALKCLHKDPLKRYASARPGGRSRALFGGPADSARPIGVWERGHKWARRRPALAALIAVSVVAVAALTVTSLVYNAWLHDENERYLQERDTATRAEAMARVQKTKAEDNEKKAIQAALEASEQKTKADANAKKAQRNLEQSMKILDKFLTGVGEVRDLFPEYMEEQRGKLFEEALAFCQEFLEENRDDPLAAAEIGRTLLRPPSCWAT